MYLAGILFVTSQMAPEMPLKKSTKTRQVNSLVVAAAVPTRHVTACLQPEPPEAAFKSAHDKVQVCMAKISNPISEPGRAPRDCPRKEGKRDRLQLTSPQRTTRFGHDSIALQAPRVGRRRGPKRQRLVRGAFRSHVQIHGRVDRPDRGRYVETLARGLWSQDGE